MIKLKSLLITESRVKEIRLASAIDICKQKCQTFLKYPDKFPVYRGSRLVVSHGRADPKKLDRKSANTKNYYTYILDNSSAWSQYPDRKNSFICTTSEETGWEFALKNGGDVYRLIPFDDARFGIAPSIDIWSSFNTITSRYKMYMNAFNDMLNDMARMVFSNNRGIRDDDYTSFRQDIIKLGSDKKRLYDTMSNVYEMGGGIPHYYVTFAYDYYLTDQNLYEFLEKLMHPDKNGFSVGKYGSLSHPSPNREVWTDSECLFINTSAYGEFKNKLGI